MPTKMTAAVLRRPGGPLELEQVLLDDPLPNEVVVRVERVGLCHSDLHYVRGSLSADLPVILGHEIAGVVEQVGSESSRLAPGQRVVATVTPACGSCAQCLAGRPTQCQRVAEVRHRVRPRHTDLEGRPIGALGGLGAFAERMVVAETALARVPDEVGPDVACLLGCCITTGVGAVVHGARVAPTDTVMVIGCGGVGIAAIQGARLAGARRIVAVDSAAGKADTAKLFGATDAIEAGDPADVLRLLRDLLPDGADHAIEAVGQPRTAELAFASLAPAGTATILGLMPEGSRLTLPADDLVYGDRVIRGAYMGANRFLSDVDMFVDHYRTGRLDLDQMVTGVVPLRDINRGLDSMKDPACVRIVVDLTTG